MNRYETLANAMAAEIRSGSIAVGSRMPSLRQIIAQHGVSQSTVFRAYYLLEEWGLVRAQERSGYYVAPGARVTAARAPRMPSLAESSKVDISDLVFSVLDAAKTPGIVPLGSAFPSPHLFPLSKAADVMDLLASVDMHGIQTSGNCIRNISCDERAGVAPDEVADPRPFAEIMRQWTTLHPEFAFLPRKFKIAMTGATEDRAATDWHDVGLHLLRNDAGEPGFRVSVGGGMGRTPVIGTVMREFLPWNQIMNYIEAVVRVYNQYGRRDNKYKARIKILVKAEGQRYIDEVEEEFRQIVEHDGGPHTIPQAELDRVSASFLPPALPQRLEHATSADALATLREQAEQAALHPMFERWLQRNVALHKDPSMRIVTLSFKRLLQAPGDASADQLDLVAGLSDRFSAGEARVTHTQNLVLPWVHVDDLFPLWEAARNAGLASANVHLLTDMIACPGGDFCALANARSIPVAEAITRLYQDLDELNDIGEIDLHISGCINSCGHHHSGHIGILGVDKDGKEWYQITLGGSDGSTTSGAAQPGKVIGPSFSAHEVSEVVDAVLMTYLSIRQSIGSRQERFIETVRRAGLDPFKAAANDVRKSEERVA
jgi:sulfite reductase (NADPH) hemoprotein beta-component